MKHKQACGEGYRLDMDPVGKPLMRRAALWTFRSAVPTKKHAIPDYEIRYTHTGNMTILLQGQAPMRVRGGDVAIIRPHQVHGGECDRESPGQYLSMCVRPDVSFPCLPFASRAEMRTAMSILRDSGNTVARACSQMEAAFVALRDTAAQLEDRMSEPLSRILVRGCLHRVFACALQSLAEPARPPKNPIIERAKRFMLAHIQERVRVPEAARAAGMSVAQLHAVFRRETGETPAAYFLRLRLERARRMLRDSSATITQIAAEMAFSSSQHFATCYKQHYGVSPSEHRRR